MAQKEILKRFWNEIREYCLEDLIEEAEPVVAKLYNYFRTSVPGCDATTCTTQLLASPMFWDRDLTMYELRMFNELLHLRMVDSVVRTYLGRHALNESSFMRLFDALPYPRQSDVVFLVMCICGADRDIAPEERTMVKRLLGKL